MAAWYRGVEVQGHEDLSVMLMCDQGFRATQTLMHITCPPSLPLDSSMCRAPQRHSDAEMQGPALPSNPAATLAPLTHHGVFHKGHLA